MARRRWNLETIQQVVDGEKPFVQVGYTPKEKRRKVGDEWTDAKGRRWKKTNNGVISVNKQADAIRELVRPRCSVCKKDMNLFGDRLDKKMFSKTGKCFDCLQVEEIEFRVTGQFEDYENLKMAKNKLSYLKDIRLKLLESIDYLKKDDSKITLVSGNGETMTWTGSQNKELLQEAENDLVEVDKLIVEVESMIKTMPVPSM